MSLEKLIAAEVTVFSNWVHDLEAIADTKPIPVSRWYYSPILECYTRSSSWCSGIAGHRAVCLANITVHDEFRSKGLFTALVNEFLTAPDNFAAEYLYVESVADPRFALWLVRNGFSASTGVPLPGCSYFHLLINRDPTV